MNLLYLSDWLPPDLGTVGSARSGGAGRGRRQGCVCRALGLRSARGSREPEIARARRRVRRAQEVRGERPRGKRDRRI